MRGSHRSDLTLEAIASLNSTPIRLKREATGRAVGEASSVARWNVCARDGLRGEWLSATSGLCYCAGLRPAEILCVLEKAMHKREEGRTKSCILSYTDVRVGRLAVGDCTWRPDLKHPASAMCILNQLCLIHAAGARYPLYAFLPHVVRLGCPSEVPASSEETRPPDSVW